MSWLENQCSFGQVRDALVFLTKSPEEKIALARKAVGKKTAPPWLDDKVMLAAKQMGYISSRLLANSLKEYKSPAPGVTISTCGDGKIYETLLTDKGRQFIVETNHFDDVISSQ